jgi:two-component system alkaline phosphatase synthesis response regulator PhoP
MAHIFVVDDEIHICELVSYNLEAAGYTVSFFLSAEEMNQALLSTIPDLILLDLMLPGMSGTQACTQLRQDKRFCNIPIIMLTAKNEEFDRVLGFELGTDDYITKPFSVREMVARVGAVLRRSNGTIQSHQNVLTAQDLILDIERREAKKGGQPLQLTYKEFELLKLFMQNSGIVLSRETLLNKIWGYDYYGETRTVDVHIRNLRRQIGDEEERYIETIRGVGYKFKGDA